VPVVGEDIRKECRWMNMVEILHIHENGKMRSVETAPGMGGREIKENGRGDKLSYGIV
jgi:hypothetical protein